MGLNFKTIHGKTLISLSKNQLANMTYGFPASLIADNFFINFKLRTLAILYLKRGTFMILCLFHDALIQTWDIHPEDTSIAHL